MRKQIFLFFLATLFIVVLVPHVRAETMSDRLTSVGTGTTGAGFSAATETTLPEKIGTIIKIFLSLIGVIFLVLLVHGGYVYMTAGGDEEDVKKAKHEITAAVIGIIIIVAAFSISDFILRKFVESVR